MGLQIENKNFPWRKRSSKILLPFLTTSVQPGQAARPSLPACLEQSLERAISSLQGESPPITHIYIHPEW